MQFEAITERMCGTRIKGRFRQLFITSTHAATEGKEENVGEVCYDNLERANSRARRYDVLIAVGEFNAKLEKNTQRQAWQVY